MTVTDTAGLTVTYSRRSASGTRRVRMRPAGPAGARTLALGSGITVRLDAAQPGTVLDTTLSDPDLMPAWTELVEVLFGPAACRLMSEVGDDDEQSCDVAVDLQSSQWLRRLLAAAASVGSRPELALLDVAAYAADVSAELDEQEATKSLSALLERFAASTAASVAYSLRAVDGYSDFLSGLAGPPAESFRQALVDLETLLGPVTSAATVVPPQLKVVANGAAGLDELEALVRGAGRPSDGVEIEVLATDLAVRLANVVMVSGTRAIHVVTGDVAPIGDIEVTEAWRRSLPRLWVRAVSVETGLLLYEAECEIRPDGLRAELVAVGAYPNDFWLDFTHDLSTTPHGEQESRQEIARRLGARAASLTESAATPDEWSQVALMWEQSARLWRSAGDPARRALSLVHAVRSWRAAGDAYAADREATQADASAALTRLDPGWSPPDPTVPATSDPLALDVLWRTAVLTPHLTAWVIRTIDALADELRSSPAGDRAKALRRVDELTRLGGSDDTVLAARARARVALALWAAKTGRRRLAHSILLPVAIDYTRLDERGRAELAETNRLLLLLNNLEDREWPDPDS